MSNIVPFDSVGGTEEGRNKYGAERIEGLVDFPIDKTAPNLPRTLQAILF